MPEKKTLPKVEVSTEPGMITISKDELARLQDSISEVGELKAMLLEVADKKQLSRYYSKGGKKAPTLVKIRHIAGKIVVGWGMVTDEVWKNENGKWVEDQKVKIVFEDGSAKEMSLRQWTKSYQFYPCERLSVITDEGGDSTKFKLKCLENNKEYEFDVKYIN